MWGGEDPVSSDTTRSMCTALHPHIFLIINDHRTKTDIPG